MSAIIKPRCLVHSGDKIDFEFDTVDLVEVDKIDRMVDSVDSTGDKKSLVDFVASVYEA